jgi:hypothetical protein
MSQPFVSVERFPEAVGWVTGGTEVYVLPVLTSE